MQKETIMKTRKKMPQGNKRKNINDIYEEEDTIVKSPYMRVCQAKKILNGEMLPTNFKFRDREAEEIEGKILSLMNNKKLLCKVVMITGSPGAGKTMTTNSVLQKLQSQKSYKIISINENRLKQQNSIQNILIHQLLPDQLQLQSQPTFGILQALQKNSCLPPTIVYVEQAQLFFKSTKEQLTEDFFDLFVNKKLNFIFLGISNTIDTLQKYCTKMGKVNSKDVVNIVFNPYTVQQLKDIILDKLRQVEKVLGIQVKIQEKLARFIANKIDEMKRGDMRKTFELLKDLSFNILPQDPSPQYCLPKHITITPQLISQIFKQKNTFKPSLLQSLPVSTQITLLSMYLWLKQNDDLSITHNCLLRKVNEIYSRLKLPIKYQIKQQIQYLMNYGTIIQKKKKEKKVRKLSKTAYLGVRENLSVRYLLKIEFNQLKTFFQKDFLFSMFLQDIEDQGRIATNEQVTQKIV